MNNLRTPPLSSCKNFPPYFFMVHLLHRLYGVDAPAQFIKPHNVDTTKVFLNKSTRRQHHVTTFTLDTTSAPCHHLYTNTTSAPRKFSNWWKLSWRRRDVTWTEWRVVVVCHHNQYCWSYPNFFETQSRGPTCTIGNALAWRDAGKTTCNGALQI